MGLKPQASSLKPHGKHKIVIINHRNPPSPVVPPHQGHHPLVIVLATWRHDDHLQVCSKARNFINGEYSSIY